MIKTRARLLECAHQFSSLCACHAQQKRHGVNARLTEASIVRTAAAHFASFACPQNAFANRWILRYAPNMKISLVIPCYNEEESLPYLVQEIDEVIDADSTPR